MTLNKITSDYINQILSASLSLMGMLIGVLGLLVSQYPKVVDFEFIASDYRFLITSVTFLIVLSGLISFLSFLHLRGAKVSPTLISYLLGFLILVVTLGIPVWVYVVIY